MALRITLAAIIPLLFSMTTLAEEIKINPAHPSEYQVAEGDTLWKIAGQFLQKPAQWSSVWQSNPRLKNPNLIYPGDVLAFSMVNGHPQVAIASSQRGLKSNNDYTGRIEKLSPQVRETPIAEAIKILPAAAIERYLASPKVIAENELEGAPYILSFAGEHLVAGAGDRIYARALPESANLNYTVYRKGQPYIDPESNSILGYEAEYIADTTLQKQGDPATLMINKAMSEIRTGDRLMPHAASEYVLNYFPRAPEKSFQGSIISVLNGVSQIGQYNIVVLNKGASEKLAVGHVLDIYQRGKLITDPYTEDKNAPVALPDELAGSLMVFRVFEHVSYALIMEATQPIHVLDKVQTP